jgi:spore coat polysaccharide biosynthesis protein SpsF
MKIGYLITARMKSTRLPKKLTLEINNRQIIRWMIDRLKLSKSIDSIIICTSINPQDDILEIIAKEEGIEIFRGHEEDVIQRLYDAAVYFNLDYALNITADCPLVSIEYIEEIIEKHKETNVDLIRTLDLPHGFFSYGLKIDALKRVCEIKQGTETEVWGRYFTDTGLFSVLDIPIPQSLQRKNYRLTLDYPEDFDFFKSVYHHFGKETYKTGITELINYLDKNPEIVDINKDLKHAYAKRWDNQNNIQLKK